MTFYNWKKKEPNGGSDYKYITIDKDGLWTAAKEAISGFFLWGTKYGVICEFPQKGNLKC